MDPFTADLRSRQQRDLMALEQESSTEAAHIEGAIAILENSLAAIREQLLQFTFSDLKQEIHFFKVILPEFQAEQLYYISRQRMLLQGPEADPSDLKKYYKKQLKKIKAFFKEYRGFCEYYRSGAGYLDERYFTRQKADPFLASQTIPIALDLRYCTPGSYTVATILANQKLEKHLTEEIKKLSRKQTLVNPADYGIKWTDSRAALEELTYALYFKGCFNSGQAEVKKLYETLCAFFGLTPGNIYKSKQDFYGRSNSAAFLDLLRKRYLEGMEETDDRNKRN